MTVAIWPAELPRPRREGYQQQLAENRLSTKRDAGPNAVRRRASSASNTVAVVFDVSADGRARFLRFWHEEIAEGASVFLMPDPTWTGVDLSDETGAVLVTDDGTIIGAEDWWLVLAGEQPPVETVIGVRYRIQMQLEVLP